MQRNRAATRQRPADMRKEVDRKNRKKYRKTVSIGYNNFSASVISRFSPLDSIPFSDTHLNKFWSAEPLRRRRRRLYQSTVGQINQEYRLQYWATRSSIRSFPCTAHTFACSRLLALPAPSAALTRSLARSFCSLPRSWERG